LSAPTGLAASVTHQAVAAAAGAGTATGGFLHLFMVLMSTKKWTTIGLILLAGTAVAPLVIRQPALEPQINVQFEPGPPPAPPVAKAGGGANIKWSDLESSDYRQFIANLRASGAPDPLINDLISLEIHRLYLPRIRRIVASDNANQSYWQKSSPHPLTPEQSKQLAEIFAEYRAVLTTLLGPEARTQTAMNLIHCQPDFDSIRLAWLPTELERKAAAALEPIREMEQRQAYRAETQADARARTERHLNALRGLLNPEQLEEYRFREDQHASNIRLMTRFSDLSQDEFKKLVDADDSRLLEPTLSTEARLRQEERLAKVLGPDRASAVVKTTDLTYGCAQEAAERYSLAADTPDRAWQLKCQALAEHDRLVKDQRLAPEVRAQELQKLTERTRSAFTELLGPNGFKLAQRDGAWWHVLQTP
jgi:hypothetical protein